MFRTNHLRPLMLIAAILLSTPALSDNDRPRQQGGAGASAMGGRTDGFLLAQFSEKVESRFFVFHSAIPGARLQHYAHFADLFLDVVNRDFVALKVTRKVNAVVLASKPEFQRFLAEQLNVRVLPEYGIYLGERNLFVTYEGAGLGTFAHEIMHFVVETMLPGRPSWAIEGVPAFFEKFYGYEEGARLQLKWGFQNPWRIRALGDRVPQLKMIRIMYGSEDTSEKRLLSVFLYQQGKLKTFLDLVGRREKNGFRTYVEAAFNKPMFQIEGEWQAYLKGIYAERERILKLPPSVYFQTAQAFAAFESEHGMVAGN